MATLEFEDQLTAHLDALRRYAIVLTRNRTEAEDLVQDCMVKAMASSAQWQPGTDLRAWLFRILYTSHISLMRKRQVRERVHAAEQWETHLDPNQQLRLEARQVVDALQALPETQRDVILTVALDDLRYEDAARRLGIPVGTFMSRLSRGREALRNIMEGRQADGKRRPPPLRIVGGGKRGQDK
ncbi:sigma-70 family RNA polymerase sigma factor [Indioceanicola profundi]|uniref:sigma-70 family RNA polymerase sigma factor n=1 Tax=Indioceanicola profundi TaxID=2220096 RepID=UPI0013C4305C|nr:sigma-70 family RNA polymerase sigma factor [Indioceanicola profundi]